MKAVIFDVDGTLVDSERDGHRVAFNLAFEELGLPDRWNVDLYGELLGTAGGERRLEDWLRDHGRSEEERRRLAPALHRRKTELFKVLVAEGRVEPRPGVDRLLDELTGAGVRVAVATTGSRDWVAPLLDSHFGAGRFDVVVTGDDVVERKPDPSAFTIALERLGLDADGHHGQAGGVVAVEDSRNGVVAATGAGLVCVAVVNDYTKAQDLSEAVLVLDGFGSPTRPAKVLADPHGVDPPGQLDLDTLRRAAAATSTNTTP